MVNQYPLPDSSQSALSSLSLRGTRIVAQALLAIPDAPPACFCHRQRQASIPLAAKRSEPSQIHCMYLTEAARVSGRQPGQKEKTPHLWDLFYLESGSDLLFRAVSSQVPSALKGLTSVFGMGTGGTLSPLPPECLAGVLYGFTGVLSRHDFSFFADTADKPHVFDDDVALPPAARHSPLLQIFHPVPCHAP